MPRAVLLCVLLLSGCIWNYAAFAADAPKPVILLDPGHNPLNGGAISIRGIYEVDYNDRFAARLTEALQKAAFHVELTRQPGQSIPLKARAELANSLKPDLFLSLHHDSAQLIYLDKFTLNEKTVYRTKKKIAGYSIFVSRDNAQFNHSWLFAQQLGKHLSELGRQPTLHHAENIPGENRELLDEKLGIYRFDELVVLKNTKIPAVLLEIGVIVDEDDEAYISSRKNQEMMIQAIVEASKMTMEGMKQSDQEQHMH
ncbi:MAG: N-acetylmuramoyl-L-alanine amidase [Syntrophobacterales bacterium]|jgi:N-acetylmuramoyl-L-alanine amidase|nr:N-acetylmuramoyl-L-alanine amidase [Syntrophobacterales bacterium]